MSERIQVQQEKLVTDQLGHVPEFDSNKFFGQTLWKISEYDPKNGYLYLQNPGVVNEVSEYILLDPENKTVANRKKKIGPNPKVRVEEVSYHDGMVECKYRISPPTQAIIITISDIKTRGMSDPIYAAGAIFLEGRSTAVSLALGEKISSWHNTTEFSIADEELTLEWQKPRQKKKEARKIPLGEMVLVPELNPYSFRIVDNESCWLFQRINQRRGDTWNLTVPKIVDYQQFEKQLTGDRNEWTKIYETLPVRLEMVEGAISQ